MFVPSRSTRRGIVGAFGAGAVAGALLIGVAPSALADPYPAPVPGCSAGDFEQVTAQVSAATSVYFYTHPDVNAFFSTLKGQPKDVVKGEISSYLDANPQTKSDLAGIRQPLHDMKAHCQ
jgi:heme-binding protein